MIAAARPRAPISPDSPTPTTPPLLVPAPDTPTPTLKGLRRRQTVVPDNPDYPVCTNVPNYVLSCWPTADLAVLQNKWYHFVWNKDYLTFIRYNAVDVYLYQADSNLPVANWTNKPTADGWLSFQVTDDWWLSRGLDWQPGKNQTIPFYFIVVETGHEFVGGEAHQPTFFAIQTTAVAAAVSSSISSSEAAASASSVRSASSASAAASGNPNPALQNGGSSDNSFPHWAIALLVVLGVLALLAFILLAYLLIRKIRSNRRKDARRRSQRSSMGSSSPMMAAIPPQSPTTTGHGHGNNGTVRSPARQSTNPHDGASSTSHAHSSAEAPFSPVDAAIMADAFRKAMRRPDFASRPLEEGESPEQPPDVDPQTTHDDLMNRELAEEGKGIRSVSSERGVKVETLHDEEGTITPKR